MNTPPIVHIGNGNIFQKYTSCGLSKNDPRLVFSVGVFQVTCIACIKRLLTNQSYKNKKTPLWEHRLKELISKSVYERVNTHFSGLEDSHGI